MESDLSTLEYTLRGKTEFMEFFSIFHFSGGAECVAVQGGLQVMVSRLLPHEIQIEALIQQGGNIRFPNFVW